MYYGELSLFFNYRTVRENIERNYKDGLFLIFESDLLKGECIGKMNKFLDFIKDKDFDIIHLGAFSSNIFRNPLSHLNTSYRTGNYEDKFIEYVNSNLNDKNFIENVTNENDEFRIIRKFTTRCTDSFLWKYSGIVKFLNFMRQFEDYSSPFDYYMCNFFEKNLDCKHYWSLDEFFIQGSNLGLISSTLKN
jgi:hypothetical protein